MTTILPQPDLQTRDDWIALLRTRGIRPSRAMGQNFLIEPEVAAAIVETADVQPGQTVLEIGPGMGMLTRPLAATGARIVAVEMDRDLARFLRDDLRQYPNIAVIEGDALQVDPGELTPGDYHLVANLPYSTGTHIVRRFLEARHAPKTMTVMLQREVAERLAAEPPEMSLLTLTRTIYATADIAFHVPPDAFWPAPQVESTVVSVHIRETPLIDRDQEIAVFRLATMAFQRKRKTIGNGLSQGLNRPKGEVEAALVSAGIDATRRPQTLSLDEWRAIVDRLSE